MSKLYGSIKGDERTAATRTGHRRIKASVQSYDGSLISELHYDSEGKLIVRISIAESESSSYGQTAWYGTFEDFIAQLKK